MLILERYQQNAFNTGLLNGLFGLSPKSANSMSDFTLSAYFHRLKLTSENQITLQRQNRGEYLLTFGSTPKNLNHTWLPYKYSDGYWRFGI